MFIKYDEFDIFELLECEPTYIHDKAVGKMMYVKENSLEFKLVLSIDVYDKIVNVSLYFKQCGIPIFEYDMQEVKMIDTDEQSLIIQNEKGKILIIGIKPSFSFKINDN